jgi:hypothetical protein
MRKLLLASLSVLLLSGCGLRAWVGVTIADDSSGTVTVQLQSDQELRDGLAAFSPETDAVAQLSDGLAEQGWDIQQVPPDGEWEGVVASNAFSDVSELSGLLGQAIQGGGGGSSMDIVETADGYRLSAELGPPSGDDNQQELLAQAAEVVDLDGRLTVHFPGDVTETNGEIQPDGTTVVWRYDEESIIGLQVEAEARKPSGLGVWIIAGVTAVVVIVVAVVAVRMRRRSALSG